jgi:hypothetical protein
MGAGWVRSPVGSNDRFKICKGVRGFRQVLEGASHELPRLGVDRLLESVVRRVARSGVVKFSRVYPRHQTKKGA